VSFFLTLHIIPQCYTIWLRRPIRLIHVPIPKLFAFGRALETTLKVQQTPRLWKFGG
jgi:hypothetical protein